MEDVKVSVLCTVYNHERYIRDALEGFVNQKTDFKYEVLIHDDASTDNSAKIIKEYENKFPDIIKPIYQTENQYSKGPGTINKILRPLVKGEFIAICEGDDYWIDDYKLQKQFDYMSSNKDCAMCVGSTIWLNMVTGKKEERCRIENEKDIDIEEIILEKNGRMFQTSSVMQKASVWASRPEWVRKFPIGDYPSAIWAALNGKVHMLTDVMSVYRWNAPGSWTELMGSDNKRANISRKMISALYELDEATDRKYTSVIKERINKHQYTLALMEHDFEAIKTGELKTIYESRNLIHRLSDFIRCKYPKAYMFIRKTLKMKF